MLPSPLISDLITVETLNLACRFEKATHSTTLADGGSSNNDLAAKALALNSEKLPSDSFNGGVQDPLVPVEFKFDGSTWTAADVEDATTVSIHTDCTFTRNNFLVRPF